MLLSVTLPETRKLIHIKCRISNGGAQPGSSDSYYGWPRWGLAKLGQVSKKLGPCKARAGKAKRLMALFCSSLAFGSIGSFCLPCLKSDPPFLFDKTNLHAFLLLSSQEP